jgi:chromosomal replication initiation ATPase DnaA
MTEVTPLTQPGRPSPPVIPRRFAMATVHDYQPRTPSQKLAKQAVVAWIKAAAEQKGVMLALVGPTGTGKSHLLYAAAKAVYELTGKRVVAGSWMSWFSDAIRYGGAHPIFQQQAVEGWEVRHVLTRAPTLLIDEIDQSAATEFDHTEIKKLAGVFYDDERPLFLTTNVSPLDVLVGPAVASRFEILTLDGPDHRKAKS